MEKVVFVGHGSPMNAIEHNEFTKSWISMGEQCGIPKAILCISAHWYRSESMVAVTAKPKTIHDFYGFPPELYAIEYDVPGNPTLAKKVAEMLPVSVEEDKAWGLDHGAWSVLQYMYPSELKIPTFQLAIDRTMSTQMQYELGTALKALRSEGVLIVGSGNIVHNLGRVSMQNDGFAWAHSFDDYIYNAILSGEHETVLEAPLTHEAGRLAVPTRDHYDPLCHILGAVGKDEPVEVFNRACTMGSLSMTSYIFG